MPPAKFDLDSGLERLFADPEGSGRLVREFASGDLQRLPKLLEPYGLYPFPPDICITLVQVLKATIPAGMRVVTRWYRYYSRPPHPPGALRTLLSDNDIAVLKATYKPGAYKIGTPPITMWDYLVKLGYIESELDSVADFVVIDETREMEICKSMHGNPIA